METTAVDPQQTRNSAAPRKYRPTEAQHREAKRLYITGHGSYQLISDKLGLSFETVKDWGVDEGWTDLRAEWSERQRQRDIESEAPPQPKPTVPEVAPQVARLAKQLADIEKLMDGEESPDALAKLSMAHSRIFDAYCTLAGIQSPGTRKPSRNRSLPAQTTPQPAVCEPSNPPENQPPLSNSV